MRKQVTKTILLCDICKKKETLLHSNNDWEICMNCYEIIDQILMKRSRRLPKERWPEDLELEKMKWLLARWKKGLATS